MITHILVESGGRHDINIMFLLTYDYAVYNGVEGFFTKVMKSGNMEYEEVDLPTVNPNCFCPYLICHLIISNMYRSTSLHIHFIYNRL